MSIHIDSINTNSNLSNPLYLKEGLAIKIKPPKANLSEAAKILFNQATEKKPLIPIDIDSANDVYMSKFSLEEKKKGIPDIIFKVGAEKGIRARICSKIAKIANLRGIIPQTKCQNGNFLVSKRDHNVQLEILDGDKWLIDRESKILVETDNDTILDAIDIPDTISYYGKTYSMIAHPNKEGLFSLELAQDCDMQNLEEESDGSDDESSLPDFNSPNNNNSLDIDDPDDSLDPEEGEKELFETNSDQPFIFYTNSETQLSYIVPKSEASRIFKEEDRLYVKREKRKYEIIKEERGYKTIIKVIGKNIDGMIQEKIEHIFQGSENKIVDFRTDSELKKKFFVRIPMPEFINAFLLMMLIRPQDGKIISLEESNVLFQAFSTGKENAINLVDANSPLRPIFIDLDETLPQDNGQSKDPHLTKGKSSPIHPVRTGLMAFPQAEKKLKLEEREYVLELIDTIVSNKSHLETMLRKYLKTEVDPVNPKKILDSSHIAAFNDVIDNLGRFAKDHRDDEWSLQDMFFCVFPEFESHWNAFSGEFPRELKAEMVGFATLEEIKNYRKQ